LFINKESTGCCFGRPYGALKAAGLVELQIHTGDSQYCKRGNLRSEKEQKKSKEKNSNLRILNRT
jgi:hypothetical protein